MREVCATFSFVVEFNNNDSFVEFQKQFFWDISHQIDDKKGDCRLISLNMEVCEDDDH